MAKAANVDAIWAKYGTYNSTEDYEKLVRISHWTAEDIVREKILKESAKDIEPDYVLENSFSEVLNFIH